MQSVLVVDDEPLVLDSARAFLERFGNMQVSTALSAKEALNILTNTTFDALVLDYYLPEINGIDLLKILRTKGDTTPVIMFTGVGRENAAIEALNNGADFFLKKGESPSSEFRQLVHMINLAAERRLVGRSLGASQKLVREIVSFFPDASFAVDRESKVIAWNKGMEALTGIAAPDIIGKGEGLHAQPFFSKKVPMLTELVFEKDETLARHNYRLIRRDEEILYAWTAVRRPDGSDQVYWMKAAPLHDTKGSFIASIGSVRDITDDYGMDLLKQENAGSADVPQTENPAPSQGQMLGRIMGRAKSYHRDGLRLSYRQGNYAEAVGYFDKALEIDPNHVDSWHDRAVCLREMGREMHALKSFMKAVELSPDNEEFLYSLADMLKRIGVLHGNRGYIEAAVRAYSRVTELNANHVDAWNGLGICMKEMGKDHAANQFFDRANVVTRQNKAKKNVRNLDLMV
ncbi:MAG: response regulator [Methanomicrobiales archaeon]|nr:response regulator [Methanomicrobiales archaeon]